LCDFKTIQPLINPVKEGEEPKQILKKIERMDKGQQRIFRYRVQYSRLGAGRFLGHLEVLQLVFRALRRAALPLMFSQGYNPSPKVSFSPALPVGVESQVEFFDMELAKPLLRPVESATQLDQQLPAFLSVKSITPIRKKAPVTQVVSYTCTLPESVDLEQIALQIQVFGAAKQFLIERIRKQKRRELNLKILVPRLEQAAEQELLFDLIQPAAAAGTNPREIMEKVLGLDTEQAQQVRVVKIKVREQDA
ncbi:MAG: DUF2344 domain-containing protein, partial [Candidatus Electrothrix sp. AR3]|nr:DUF2344 domain-containing protein [Candidatus Electrothrix sp. AR3]